MSIVQITENYTYEIMRRELIELNRKYTFLQMGKVGESVLGKGLYAVRIGTGQRKIFYNAAIHANEWITTVVLMKFIEDYANAYQNKGQIYGQNAVELYQRNSLYIMPMVNPDGVNLLTQGIQSVENISQNKAENVIKIANNFSQITFPNGWKANINGVDLNLQFPAEWNRAKQIKYSLGFNRPAPRDFPGYGPLTEPEALAIYDFTLYHNFELAIAYHTQGKEIYWQFLNYEPPQSEVIANEFARVSGYTVAEVPYESSFAGYKDWFIQQYRKPGFTIEAGSGINPLPISQFNEIYNDNIGILVLGLASYT